MVPREYAVAYGEVLEICRHISKEDVEKIPNNMIEMLKTNASEENDFRYDITKTLKEQNVSETARVIIAILFRDYWSTPEQREKIISKENHDRAIEKEENCNSSDAMFVTKSTQEVAKEIAPVSTALVERKESFFRRIWNKIIGR